MKYVLFNVFTSNRGGVNMLSPRDIVTGILILLVMGCQIDYTDVQNIDINFYPDNAQNVALVREIARYNEQYISAKIPALDAKTMNGVSIGYVYYPSGGVPKYRITYSLLNSGVRQKISLLKSQFAEFIPKLATTHAAKKTLYAELDLTGREWARELLLGNDISILKITSNSLKENHLREKFKTIQEQFKKDYGKLAKIEMIGAEYYENYRNISEVVILLYKAEFTDNKTMDFSVNFMKESDRWMVVGFN